ncbi:MAG: 30S ribosomal protein S6 [Magnetococcales bacterium]|nr:30S ribosomal protein S6 [Magnetococcales bacterium]
MRLPHTDPQGELMAYYETVYIIRADLTTEQIEQIIARMKDIITANSGQVLKTELWGRRQLAYPVKKNSKGFYVFHVVEGKGQLISNLEERMKLDEDILKFQTIRIASLPQYSSPLAVGDDRRDNYAEGEEVAVGNNA